MNNTLPLAAACAIALTTAAIAAPPQASVTTNANHTVVFAHPTAATSHFTPSLAHRSGLSVIYQNFATAYPKGPYNAFTGAPVSGFATLHGELWIASAFTPAASASVQEIDVPLGYITGDHNTVQLHIYADANGIPGADLWQHKVAMTNTFGTCCAILAYTLKAPLRLTAGTQYWIGITSVTGAQDAAGAWNFAVADQITQYPYAENNGTGWQSSLEPVPPAFGIYGK